jgi:hypothetical protein
MNKLQQFLDQLSAKGIQITIAWETKVNPFILRYYMLAYNKEFESILIQIWPDNSYNYIVYMQPDTSLISEDVDLICKKLEIPKPVVNYIYNNDTKNMDLLVDGVPKHTFSSKDADYLTSRSYDEVLSDRCMNIADRVFGKDNYKLGYYINGNGYKVNNP